MNTYIENYGFAKTIVEDNKHKIKNEIKWIGDYDGNIANIKLDINDNGSKEFVSMQLDNNDLMKLLGIQPVQIPLEQRLSQDFLRKSYTPPISLEGALIQNKTRKYYNKSHSHKSHSRKSHSHKSHSHKSHSHKSHSHKSHSRKSHSHKNHSRKSHSRV